MRQATFAAGCFWSVQAEFDAVHGVVGTIVGYSGGSTEKPTYDQVCRHATGHAESVQVTFDPAVISYEKLVERFFDLHDPTQLNRQGLDVGDQYRSAIFVHSKEQQEIAYAVKDRLDKSERFTKPIVTAIESVQTFWPAEEYHQKYFARRGGGGCRIGM